MFIWILALVLLGLFAAIGFFKGAIRMAVSVVGLFLGLALAMPLSPMMAKILPSLGVKNPVWLWVLPPVVVFILISLVFIGVSFFVHQKLSLHYKYKTDDFTFLKWERMNRRLGLPFGLLVGTVYFFLISLVIYVVGYLTVQVSAEENVSGGLKFINQARRDMEQTGFDKTLASLDPMKPSFYESVDVIGLVYQNPILQNRIYNYPPYLSLTERPEFQEIAGDKEFNDLLFSRADIKTIINHPRTQSILGNAELMQQLKQVDLKDLDEFLHTGKSRKYDNLKILGRWIMDKDAVVIETKKKKPDISSADLMTLRRIIAALPEISLVATVDNRILLKAGAAAAAAPADPNAAATGEAAPAEPAPPAPPPPPRGQRGQRPPPAAPTPDGEGPKVPTIVQGGEGKWEGSGDLYQITVTDQRGKEYRLSAKVEGEDMTLTTGDQILVFFRAE